MQVLAALSNEMKEREARAVRAEEAMARDEKKYQKKVHRLFAPDDLSSMSN